MDAVTHAVKIFLFLEIIMQNFVFMFFGVEMKAGDGIGEKDNR